LFLKVCILHVHLLFLPTSPATALPDLAKALKKKPSQNGAPFLIFLTGAALRVADVTRILKDKQLHGKNSGSVAKLFARHFKLDEHVDYLKRTKIGTAVGTPGRVGKLLS
jgi:protein CMS1